MSGKFSERSISQNVYIGMGVIFLGCLLVQFLLAGMSVFDDPTKWGVHKRFVHIFGYTIPLLMIISSVTGKFFSLVYKEMSAVFLLIFIMYLTANVGWHVGWLGAFHPVAGVLLITTASMALVKVYKRGTQTSEEIAKYKQVKSKEKGLLSWLLIGLVGGFIAGLLLSNIVGIIGFVLFDEPIGIKFLPFYLSFISTILVPVWMYKRKGSNL